MLAHRHPRRRLGATLAAVLALPLTACVQAQETLYISSTTVLGLDASVNTARTSGRVQLGYDRYFVTWVPQTVNQENGAREVMSALNCTEVKVGSLALLGFDESLATGVAAQNFSQNWRRVPKAIPISNVSRPNLQKVNRVMKMKTSIPVVSGVNSFVSFVSSL